MVLAACGTDDTGRGSAGGDEDTGVDAGLDVAEDSGTDARVEPDVPVEDAADEDVEEDVVPDIELDIDPELPALPPELSSVETVLSTAEAPTGTTVFATCKGVDSTGATFTLDEEVSQRLFVAPQDYVDVGSNPLEFTPTRAGSVSVACYLPGEGLVDDTPAELTVLPGVPYTVVAELDTYSIRAGEFVQVTCTALDVYGNVLEDFEDFEIGSDPFGEGIEIDTNDFVTVTRAGVYSIRCDTDGAAEVVPAELEVVANLPASLTISVVPDKPVYQIGEVAELRYNVEDAFGNPIRNAPVTFASLPTVPTFGGGRFRFEEEGIFALTAIVGLPTESGDPLIAQTEVTVNSEGPSIVCESPANASFVNTTPGTELTFRGQVNDEFGADEVLINGVEATVLEDGTFTGPVNSRFGINFVEIDATDTFGASNRRTCAYLAGNQWSLPDAFLGDAVTLGVTQDGFDDENRGDGLDSINDILYTVLNSAGLRNALHSALQSASPFYDECVQRVFGICILDVDIRHEDTEIRGPNDVSLTLVDGGMRTVATVRGLRVRLRIRGTFGTSGWVTFDRLGVDITFNTGLEGGRPRVTLRSLNNVDVGGIDTDFSGITGFILDLIVDIFEGTIRDLVRDTAADYIRDEFNAVLDGVLSGLDISSFGTSIDVPRLDGTGSYTVGFGIQFSLINFNTARALFGIGTRFSGAVARATRTLGAPIPPGAVRFEPSLSRSVGAGISLGLLNQILHTLWRGGFFDVDLSADIIGSDADGSIAAIRTNLPPLAVGTEDGGVAMMIGGMRASVVIPGIIDVPVIVEFGAVASSGVDLLPGDELSFRDITVDELYFSTEEASLDPVQVDALEDFLRDTAQYIVDDSLNGALPTLPIPVFEVPGDLDEFGIPRGTALGILDPILAITDRHFVVEGNFGNR